MAVGFTQAILEWARTKPADEAYDYCKSRNCVVAQFLRETGRAIRPNVDPDGWSDGPFGRNHALDARIDSAAVSRPETFGAFADRLAALVAAQ